MVSKDFRRLLGSVEHVKVETVPGGHGFPIPSCDELVKLVCKIFGKSRGSTG